MVFPVHTAMDKAFFICHFFIAQHWVSWASQPHSPKCENSQRTWLGWFMKFFLHFCVICILIECGIGVGLVEKLRLFQLRQSTAGCPCHFGNARSHHQLNVFMLRNSLNATGEIIPICKLKSNARAVKNECECHRAAHSEASSDSNLIDKWLPQSPLDYALILKCFVILCYTNSPNSIWCSDELSSKLDELKAFSSSFSSWMVFGCGSQMVLRERGRSKRRSKRMRGKSAKNTSASCERNRNEKLYLCLPEWLWCDEMVIEIIQ